MRTHTIHKSIKRDDYLISVIELKNGWYIDWQSDCIRLSADNEEKLSELIEYFGMLVKID